MATQTLAPAVLDALRTTWSADPTLSAAVTAGTLGIYDGPPVTDRSRPTELWIGASGTDPDETVVSGAQDLVDFEGDVDEQLDITCAVWASAGGTDIAAARSTALALFNAAVTAIRGTTLGLAALRPVTSVTSWDLRQTQAASGVGAVLTFTVHAEGSL